MIGNSDFALDILSLSVFSYVFVFLAYTLGVWFFNFKSESVTRTTFYNLVAGCLFIISIFSVFTTQFKTVNSVVLLLLLLELFRNRSHLFNGSLNYKALAPLLYIFPTLFLLYGLYEYGLNIKEDIRYYSKITYALYKTGQENLYHFYNIENAGLNGMAPYHYIEMWFASFFSILTNSLAVFSLKNFSYPFLISMIAFGFISLFERQKIMTFILFLLLSLIPVCLILADIDPSGWILYSSFWLRPNLISYYLILIAIFCALKDKNWPLFYLFTGIGLTFSVLIVPGILAGMVALIFYRYKVEKIPMLRELKSSYSAWIALALIMLLYFGFRSEVTSAPPFDLKSHADNLLKLWKAIMYTLFMIVLQISIIPIIALILNKIRFKAPEYNYFIVLLSGSLAAGLVLFQGLTQLDNSYQFPYFGYAAVGLLLLLILTHSWHLLKHRFAKIATLLCALFFAVYFNNGTFGGLNLKTTLATRNLELDNITPQMSQKILQFFELHPNAKGGGFLNQAQIAEMDPLIRHCLTRQFGSFLCFYSNECNLPNVNCSSQLIFDIQKKYPEHEVGYSKCMAWMKAFSKYRYSCDPTYFLRNKKLDFIVCSIETEISTQGFNVIEDKLSQIKLVYR